MTSRMLLTDLLKEIEAVTEYTEPGEPVRLTDTVHREDCSVDLKKVFTLRMKYGAEIMRDQMSAMIFVAPLSQIPRERETEFKATVLNALLWQLVALQFPAEKQELIGIRKGWVLVSPLKREKRETPLTDFEEDFGPGPVTVN